MMKMAKLRKDTAAAYKRANRSLEASRSLTALPALAKIGQTSRGTQLTSIIGSLIIGLIVGAVARALLPGRDPMGCFATALLGVGGSIVGGLIGSAIWPAATSEGYTHPHRLLHFALGSYRCGHTAGAVAGNQTMMIESGFRYPEAEI